MTGKQIRYTQLCEKYSYVDPDKVDTILSLFHIDVLLNSIVVV